MRVEINALHYLESVVNFTRPFLPDRFEWEAEYMIKAGIIGSTGYAGGELVRILL